jgi:hypothetical protein
MNARVLVSVVSVVAALCVGAAINVNSSPGTRQPHLSQVALEDLRVAYLVCDRIASQLELDADTGTRCALVSRALVQRGFGGSVEDLLTWRNAARTSGFAARQATAFKTLALAARDRDAAARVQDQPVVAFRR